MPGTYYVHKKIYYYNFPLSQRVGNAKKGNRQLKPSSFSLQTELLSGQRD